MISVIVTYRAHPGVADELEGLLAIYGDLVRSEPGCHVFEASRSAEDRDVIHLYEVYDSRAALDAHVESSHYAAYVTQEFLPRLAERSVTFGTPVQTPTA